MRTAKMLKVTMQVEILVERDGQPEKTMTTPPFSVSAADWERFYLPIDEMCGKAIRQVESEPEGGDSVGELLKSLGAAQG